MENISVSNSHLITDEQGQLLIECFMTDNSIWRCDTSAKNWVKVVPSTTELTAAFNGRDR